MNNLQIRFENESPVVSARELHEALEITTRYNDWFPRMIEYGFEEDKDFYSKKSKTSELGGRPSIDHEITIDMAKELCMIQRNEKGKQFRRYFIEVEKEWNSPEKVMARALVMAQRDIDSLRLMNVDQAEKIEKDKPKVLFADAVAGSETSILVRDFVKILEQNGINTGEVRFFRWLRANGYLMKSTSSHNIPTQKSMELKVFEVREGTRLDSEGKIVPTFTPLVTTKGQQYFINKFLGV